MMELVRVTCTFNAVIIYGARQCSLCINHMYKNHARNLWLMSPESYSAQQLTRLLMNLGSSVVAAGYANADRPTFHVLCSMTFRGSRGCVLITADNDNFRWLWLTVIYLRLLAQALAPTNINPRLFGVFSSSIIIIYTRQAITSEDVSL